MMSIPREFKPPARPHIEPCGPTLYVRADRIGPNMYQFECPMPHCHESIRSHAGPGVGNCGHEFEVWPLAGGGADATFDRWQVS